jgi:HEPN domain-containing protein
MLEDKKYDEWFFQSDYDLETAEYMLKSGRNVYCIFMCHLSLEKALKGLLKKWTGEEPIKLHNLIYFVDKIGLHLTPEYFELLSMLNKVSIPTRYPDDLHKLITVYTQERTTTILQQTKMIQEWIKQQ